MQVRLHVLRQLHDIRRCLTLVERDEAQSFGGGRYERVVHSRLEFVWLAPHPPLSLLRSSAVWIPSGEDYYGGVNDRHAVLDRSHAEIYMRRWDLIVSGAVMRIEPQLRRGVVSNGITLQDENLVAALARYFHLPLRRFAAAMYLGCCSANTGVDAGKGAKKKSACFSRACVNRAIPSRQALLDVCSAAANGAGDGVRGGAGGVGGGAAAAGGAAAVSGAVGNAMASARPLTGKYRSEVEQAVQHSLALLLPGARYTLQEGVRKMAQCLPNRNKRLGAGRQRVRSGALCTHVGISAPGHFAQGFRAVLAKLKRRAFRGESDHLVWS